MTLLPGGRFERGDRVDDLDVDRTDDDRDADDLDEVRTSIFEADRAFQPENERNETRER